MRKLLFLICTFFFIQLIISCTPQEGAIPSENACYVDTAYYDFVRGAQTYYIEDSLRLETNIEHLIAEGQQDMPIYAKALLFKSALLYQNYDYLKAIDILEEAIAKFNLPVFEEENDLKRYILNQQGLNYQGARKIHQAILCSEKVIAIHKATDEIGGMVVEAVNISTSWSHLQEAEKALEWAKKARKYYKQLPWWKRQFTKYYDLAIYNVNGIAKSNLAKQYKYDGRLDKSAILLHEAESDFLEIESSFGVIPKENAQSTRVSLAKTYYFSEEDAKIEQAIQLLKANEGAKDTRIRSRTFCYLTGCYTLQGKFEQAIAYSDSSLLALNFALEDVANREKFARLGSKLQDEAVRAIEFRARVYATLYDVKNNVTDLEQSLQLYQQAIQLVEQLSIEATDQYRINTLRGLFSTVYKDAVLVQKKYYTLYKDAAMVGASSKAEQQMKKILEEGLQINMQGQSFALRQQIQTKIDLEKYTGIVKQLIEEDSKQIGKINYLESSIAYPKDSVQLVMAQEELIKVYRERDALLEQMQSSKHAAVQRYYAGRYNVKVPNAEDLETAFLDDSTAIINYVFIQDEIFAFVLTKKQFFTIDIPYHPAIIQHLDNLREQISKESVGSAFRESSAFLHHTFMAGIIEKLPKHKHFIIVPSEQMYGIPFEAFLKTTPKHGIIADYPFLVYDYYFSYVYALGVQYLFEELYKNQPIENDELGIFIAKYNKSDMTYATTNRFAGGENEGLRCSEEPLEALTKAAKTIALVEGRSLFPAATEQTFRDSVHHFGRILLTMHGCTENDNPLNYSLVFTKGEITVGEIYTMDMRLKWAYLASCSANYGPLQRGEGLSTISRAFTVAGCPNLITTLNKIQDKEGAILLEHFFYFLEQGQQPAIALTNAKRRYLSNIKNDNKPYFWANTVSVGISKD